ncbi:MAG: thiamine pyrophosphate-binding protein [Pseudomonadota bacterium]
MKLSDYVADFIAHQGVRHVFAISGGASLHLIHSIANHPHIDYVCPLHEQAGAMAADAYSRITRNLGVAIGTSGPGGTNMVTGICGAYYDSVPVLYITGQVATFRFKGETGVRQYGFQETDIVSVCRPITKYAVTVINPKSIRYELEKACHIAKTGRPGPVLVDIPDNLQREQIDPATLEGYVPEVQPPNDLSETVRRLAPALYHAKRPILILGWGVRLAGADIETLKLVDTLGIPVVPTWGMADFLPADHPLLVGTFGTHGTRYGNFAVQNADLILAIGTRLDTHETGSPLSSFAREAVKIAVDIDETELRKAPHFGMKIDFPVQADAGDFVKAVLQFVDARKLADYTSWKAQVSEWVRRYPVCPEKYFTEGPVNPYVLVRAMSDRIVEDEPIVIDTGCAIAWMMQAFRPKKGQRLIHDFNNTAMGYALPAAIGISVGRGNRSVVCVSGDGSLQMNIQELATVLHYGLPVKIILINNGGYSMIQQTQDQWLGSKYVASSPSGGVAAPDFGKIAQAYGYPVFTVRNNASVSAVMDTFFAHDGPAFCDVQIRSDHRVIPQVKYGRPIEDSEPLLSRDEFRRAMIVRPLDVSLIDR